MQNNFEFNSSSVRAGDCVSDGWKMISSNYGLFLGMTVVFFIILIAVSLIPYIGGIVNQFLYMILICGMFIAMVARSRGEQPNFSMLFEGFSRIAPCVVVALIYFVPSLLLLMIFIPYFLMAGNMSGIGSGALREDQIAQIFNGGMLAGIVIVYLVFLLITLLLKIFLIFSIPLVADRNVGVGEAISLSFKAAWANIGGLILLVLLEILIFIGGMLMFCIGIIFVFPIVLAAEYIAYRQVFPDSRNFFNNEPPSPDAYGGNYGMPQNFQ